MNKTWLIIKREYLTRVVKKSFIIITILGPIVMAALIVAPAYLSSLQEHKVRTIAVIDQTGVFDDTLVNTTLLNNLKLKKKKIKMSQVLYRRLPDTKYIKFEFLPSKTSIDSIRKNFESTTYYALLFIPKNLLSSARIQLYSNKDVALNIKMYLSSFFKDEIEKEKLKARNIDLDILKSVKTDINIETIKWTTKGEVKTFGSEIAIVLGFFTSFLIYFFVFMYSSMVIRGVIEEKVNRIIEIIISSVKPFNLLIGKIIGVALVGFTQFLLWIVLTFVIVSFVGKSNTFTPKQIRQKEIAKSLIDTTTSNELQPVDNDKSANETTEFSKEILTTVSTINWTVVIITFFLYFIGGYLLYGSLFAAIGASVDNETDTQQFIFPITIPLIISMVMIQTFVNYPDSSLSFWFSVIPFTSPIAMMARIPFGVPVWEVLLSLGVLAITIYISTLFSAKIYRVGILMYGKKASWKNLVKWLKLKL